MRIYLLFLLLIPPVLAFSQASLPMPPAPAGYTVHADLPYRETPQRRLHLDLLLPGDDGEARPILVWIHGGAWRMGDKRRATGWRYIPQGWAFASVQYRLTGDAIFPAQIEDCKAAIQFLKHNARRYRIDPARVFVGGESAGGHLAALLGTTGNTKHWLSGDFAGVDARVAGVVDLYGPTNFLTMDQTGGSGHDAPNSPESVLVGGPIQDNPEKVRVANPITYVDSADPPFLLLHGTADRTVPFNQSELLRDALQAAGVPHTLMPLEGAAHGGPRFSAPEPRQAVADFLRNYGEKR